MTALLATSFLAQRADWLEGAIIVGIVVLSMIGSAGKWIVKQIAESKERNAQRREGMPIHTPHERDAREHGNSGDSHIPPFAAPLPPTMRPARFPATQTQPPAMERMMEVLLEKAAGTPLERRVRELMPAKPAPPPTSRASEPRVRKQAARPPAPAKRAMTLAEREASRERVRQTEVERETQRLVEREQQFTDDTDQRLGHVEAHLTAADHGDSTSADANDFTAALDDADSLRRAFVLSEILAPPLALRQPAHQ